MNEAFAQLGRTLTVRGTILFADSVEKALTATDIASISINENCTGTSILPIGTACAASLSLSLNNMNGRFEQGGSFVEHRTLEDAIINLEVGIDNDGTLEWHPLGEYVVKEAKASEQSVTIAVTATDRLDGTLSKTFADTWSAYPCTVLELAQRLATLGQVTLATTDFPNASSIIYTMPEWLEGTAVRDALGCIAAIAGGFARINRLGQLEIVSLNVAPTHAMDVHRYKTFDRQDMSWGPLNQINVTADDGEVSNYIVDPEILESPKNTLEVSGNPLINSTTGPIMLAALAGLNMEGGTVAWQGDPAVMLGDYIEVTDLSGRKTKILNTTQTITCSPGLSMTSGCKVTGDAKSAGQRSGTRIITPSGSLNASTLEGAINAMRNRIFASSTYEAAEIRESEGVLLENNNPESPDYGALYLGPGIWAIASTKNPDGKWAWRTAATGESIVADAITTGILNAGQVTISMEDASNPNLQIAMGKYDGEHYGIGYTEDGGETWKTAIGFDGVHINVEQRLYTVLLSTYNLSYVADSSGVATPATNTIRAIGYTGGEKIAPTIGSITGIPTGMAIVIGDPVNNETPIAITVPAGQNLGDANSLSGVLGIPILTPIQTTLTVSWSKVNEGADGDGAIVFSIYAPNGNMFPAKESTLTLQMQNNLGTTNWGYYWDYWTGTGWRGIDDDDQQGNRSITIRGEDVPLMGNGASGTRTYRCEAWQNDDPTIYRATITVSHLMKESLGALVEILNTVIGFTIYEANYLGDNLSIGDTFPANPTVDQAFIKTSATDMPRYYKYSGTAWEEQAAGRLLASGIRIEPDKIEMFTKSLMLKLLDPDNDQLTLMGMDNNGILFTGKDGATLFHLDFAASSLSFTGVINALAGNLGGFLLMDGAISGGAFEVTNKGKLTAGDMVSDPKRGFWLGSQSSPYFDANRSEARFRTRLAIDPAYMQSTRGAANVYCDPATGIFYLTSNIGTQGLSATVSLDSYTPNVGQFVTATATARNGSGFYNYNFTIYHNGSIVQTSGTQSSPGYSFVPQQVGVWHVACLVTDTSGSTTAYGGSRSAKVSADYDLEARPTVTPGTAPAGTGVRFAANVSGAVGAYEVRWTLHRQDGGVVQTGVSDGFYVTLSTPGIYSAIFVVTDTVTSISVSSPVCVIT